MSQALELERQLWRREYGKVAPEILEIEIRHALDRLGDETVDLLAHAAAIRLWNPQLLQARTDAFRSATRAADMLQYRKAIEQIRCCERAMATTRELLEAIVAANGAEDETAAVYELASVGRLRALPAVAALAQIGEAARQCIANGQYSRAAQIAAICARLAGALRQRRSDLRHGDPDVEERLRAIEDLCEATRPFAAPNDDPLRDGSLTVMRDLFAQGFTSLATRLLAELETQLGGRRRFLLYAAQVKDPEEARALVADVSWDGAVDHYWHRSLVAHADAIEQQRLHIEKTMALLETALSGEATT